MAIKRYAGDRFTGLSTDTKPSNIEDGALFNELNTKRLFLRNSSTWQTLDADTLDGQHGSYYLNYNNFSNTPTIPSVGNGTLTVTGNNGLSGSGTFTANQSVNNTITISHADTSSQASVNNSNGTVIQDVTLDGYGHVTGLVSANLDSRYLQSYTETDTLNTVTGRGNTTTNSISVGAVTISNDTVYDGETTTLSTTTLSQIASFPSATYDGGKLLVQVKDNVTNERHISEILVTHNGTNAFATEYGVVFTGSSPLATFDVDISGGNVRLLTIGASANSTQYRITEILARA